MDVHSVRGSVKGCGLPKGEVVIVVSHELLPGDYIVGSVDTLPNGDQVVEPLVPLLVLGTPYAYRDGMSVVVKQLINIPVLCTFSPSVITVFNYRTFEVMRYEWK